MLDIIKEIIRKINFRYDDSHDDQSADHMERRISWEMMMIRVNSHLEILKSFYIMLMMVMNHLQKDKRGESERICETESRSSVSVVLVEIDWKSSDQNSASSKLQSFPIIIIITIIINIIIDDRKRERRKTTNFGNSC